MEKEQKEIDNYFDLEEDYEIEEFEVENYIDINDLYYEIWQEAIRERDLIFNENPFEGLDYQSSEEELEHIKRDVLSVVNEVLTPTQAVALYFFSNYDAEFSNCPCQIIPPRFCWSWLRHQDSAQRMDSFCRHRFGIRSFGLAGPARS